jgi:hypothetical protein
VNIQCDLCGEVAPLADFAARDGGIEVRCGACGGRCFVAAARPVGATAPATAVAASAGEGPAGAAAAMILTSSPAALAAADATTTCPKCGRSQAPAEACRFCGLVFARWDPAVAGPAQGDEEARRLFAAAEAAWTDEARHEAFVGYCAAADGLPFAARCYRERLTRGDDPVARAGQQRVVRVAELTYLTTARERRDAPLKHRRLILGIAVAVFLAVIVALLAPLWRSWLR